MLEVKLGPQNAGLVLMNSQALIFIFWISTNVVFVKIHPQKYILSEFIPISQTIELIFYLMDNMNH